MDYYKLILYCDEQGGIPVKEAFIFLPPKMRMKIYKWFDLLEKEGPVLKRPYADKVKDKIYELRVRLGPDNIRILYFFFVQNRIVLIHAFRKKENRIKAGDLEIAEKRMNDFINRYQKG